MIPASRIAASRIAASRIAASRGIRTGVAARRRSAETAQKETEEANDLWLQSRMKKLEEISRRDVHLLHLEALNMARDLDAQVASRRNTMIEAKRMIHVNIWRILVVYGTVGLSALHLMFGASA